MPSIIPSMFAQGVDGWDEYKPTGDQRNDDRAIHGIMSAVAAVISEPLAITGTTRGEDTWPLNVAALGEHLTVEVLSDGTDTFVDVHANSTLESIRIDSAPLTTSGLLGVHEVQTAFTLIFSWGTASVNKYHGTEDNRQAWLALYLDILARR